MLKNSTSRTSPKSRLIGFEGYIFPPTLNRSATATLLVDSTPGGMMQAVITCLLPQEYCRKLPQFHRTGNRRDIMLSLRHPQHRWDDTRNHNTGGTPKPDNGVQRHPDYSAGGNSQGETENASPFSDTPRIETTPTHGASRGDATLTNTCVTASTDSNEETKGPGHTRHDGPTPGDNHVSRDST